MVEGRSPAAWVEELVAEGALDLDLAVGLVAALLQKQDEAGAVSEAARIAARLGRRELGELVLVSLEAFDTALLLHGDPMRPGRSVEDALLEAATALVDLDEATTRATLLPRLRHAGLIALEIDVVAVHGTPDEIGTWMPAVLVEGLPPEGPASLALGLARGGEATEALLRVLEEAPPAVRTALAQAIEESPRREVLVGLVPRLFRAGPAEA